MKEKILLDTDIGSDIDDAICLSYLLLHPGADLLGISTVSGKARERAALADALCRAAGKPGIPIVSGCEHSMTTGLVVQPDCRQSAALSSVDHRPPGDFPENEAVPFLRRVIREHPGEITLLAIGPMTNLGLLFALDPEIPGLLKRLVLMCGIFNTNAPYADPCYSEWNALCDPIATRIVYRSRVKEHLSCGLDVTTSCVLPAKELTDRFEGSDALLSVLKSIVGAWNSGPANVVFHDPLAGALIFEPGLCGWRSGEVRVVTDSPGLEGMTVFDTRSGKTEHKVAVKVDDKAFFRHFFGVLSGG